MIISCTNKLINHINKYQPVSSEKNETSFNNWYADLIIVNRKKHALITNSKTLFSIIIYLGTKKEKLNFQEIFIEKLNEQIVRQIKHYDQITKLINNKSNFIFNKTNSYSVLGSMNEIKRNLDYFPINPNDLNDSLNIIMNRLNKIPMGGKKYWIPVEYHKSELEKLLHK